MSNRVVRRVAYPNGTDHNPVVLVNEAHGWWKIVVACDLTFGNGRQPTGCGSISSKSLRRWPIIRRKQPNLLRLTARALLCSQYVSEASVVYGGADGNFIRIHIPERLPQDKAFDSVMATLRQLPYTGSSLVGDRIRTAQTGS